MINNTRLNLRASSSLRMSRVMNRMIASMAFFSLCLVSCDKKPDRVTVTETRKLTTKDQEPKLFATSDERFRDSKPSPVQGTPPENWLVVPPSQFRVLNYRFGESGVSEVYVSLVSGGIMENVNRWLQQFGQDPLDAQKFQEMERVPIAGAQGVWVEAAGTFGGGPMSGGGSKPDYGLAGVIARIDDKLVTIKMVGPAEEVEAEKQALRNFAKSLRLAGAAE